MTDSTAHAAATENPPVTPESTTGTPPEGTAGQVFDAAYVSGLRAEAGGYRVRLRDTEASLTEERNARTALSTEVESLRTTATTAEQRAAQAEAKALRYEVAAEKGLPLSMADRLKGDTREALAADAETFASSVVLTGDTGQGARKPPAAPKPSVNDAFRALAGK